MFRIFKNHFKILGVLILFSNYLSAQNEIFFKKPLKFEVTEKINSEISKGSVFNAESIAYILEVGDATLSIKAKNEDGKSVIIPFKKLNLLNFQINKDLDEIWEKNLLNNGTYESLLKNGYQYELRNELNLEAVSYINTLEKNGCFFKDKYFEDFLYTIINKIHSGNLNDDRPGNFYIKILKDPEPNAFALPNGCIIISTGLLSTIQSEDELAGIIAHEIAHFVLDHQVLNHNKELERNKRAEFWSAFATVIAAGADAYLSIKNADYFPGLITTSTTVFASVFSNDVLNRLGIKYNQSQETAADRISNEILETLKYDKNGLSAALLRMKKYFISTGNYLALSGSGTHPSMDDRIKVLGDKPDLKKFIQADFLKKNSLVNSENAWHELWHNANQKLALELVNRNISNGIGTESDYLVKAIALRRLSNSKESNDEVLKSLSIAKNLNINPISWIFREEGITHLRMGNKTEAKKAFENYLTKLNEHYSGFKEIDGKGYLNNIREEIIWTRTMIFKSEKL